MINDDIKVDSIITDPPYNISKKNNFKTIGRSGIDFGEWDKDFNQFEWLQKLNKIIKPGGSIIIFNDWKNLGDISRILEKFGFEIKDVIRWIKPSPMPRNVNRRYVTDYEFAIWLTFPGEKWIFNKPKSKSYLKPEYTFAPPMGNNRIHPTQKSGKMIEEIIKVHTNEGDIIFDPFSGSGEISVTANKLNRYFIASEIDKKYWCLSNKRIKNSFIKPVFNHLGNKYRMIEELMRQFPRKNIDYFIDVFAGSGIVGLSYKTPKKIFLNDKDKWLCKILQYLFNTQLSLILKNVEDIIKKYKLPMVKKGYAKEYKKLRDDFNNDKQIDILLVLILYGFNQQIRFNSKGDFNIPPGKFYWNEYHKNKLISFVENTKDKKFFIKSNNFSEFVFKILDKVKKENSLFYFDPPYYISNATYNSGWCKENEKKLIEILQYLTDNGYKWFLSNLLESKGNTNKLLDDFIKKNSDKIDVIDITNITYKNSNYQRKIHKKKDVEILIKGYK